MGKVINMNKVLIAAVAAATVHASIGSCNKLKSSTVVTGGCFTAMGVNTTIYLNPLSADTRFQIFIEGSGNKVVLAEGISGVIADSVNIQGFSNSITMPNSSINTLFMKGSGVSLLGANTKYCIAKKITGTPHTNKALGSQATCACFKSNFTGSGCRKSSYQGTLFLQ